MFSLLSALLGTLFVSLKITSPSSFPKPLSPEEEADCIAKIMQGDTDARNYLVEHNLRLVSHIIKKYYAGEDNHDDLISIGTLGLIKAAGSFRPDKCTKFATYAARCVENEIFMYFRTVKKRACEVSIDSPLETGNEDSNTLDLADCIGQGSEEMLDAVDDRLSAARLRHLVLTILDPRERNIIVTRYGLNGNHPQTQREIAKKTGLSRSYISRIEKKALQKLKVAFLK